MNWITAKAKGKTGELLIYGDISDVKWYEEDVTPLEVDKAIKELKDCTDIIVRVNSYGGSVFAGLAIVSMIKNIKAHTTAIIEGIGASMGSVIPLACDKVLMSENAMMMIHKPSSWTCGNADDMRKEADLLDKCENQLINIYLKRYKGTVDDLREKLKNETWLTATEALELGLIDEIDKSVDMVASAKGIILNKLEIDKSSKIYATLQQKGAIPQNMEIKEKLKALGCEIVKNDTVESVLNKLSDVLNKLETQAKAEVSVIENEDGSKSVIKGETEIAKVEPKVIEKEVVKEVVDETLKEKAEWYDEIKKSVIEEALKNGIKAKGDSFNKDRWGKAFDSFSIDEIKAQSEEWLEEAKKELNAGVHKTQFEITNTTAKKVNYNF